MTFPDTNLHKVPDMGICTVVPNEQVECNSCNNYTQCYLVAFDRRVARRTRVIEKVHSCPPQRDKLRCWSSADPDPSRSGLTFAVKFPAHGPRQPRYEWACKE